MADYIPPELIRKILAKLPVDDLLRCTSVCKSWYALITSPSFASSHLNLSSPNQEPRLLIRDPNYENRRTSYRLYRDNQTFDEIAKLDPPNQPNLDLTDSDWQISASLNGIVCLCEYYDGKIVLWNPSLRKSLILPKSRVSFSSGLYSIIAVGFGFVATSNEYKIVLISYLCETEQHEAQIYELGTGSWRDLKLENYTNVCFTTPQAHLNGILHWNTCNIVKFDTNLSPMICSLDMKNEKFGSLMFPRCLRDNHMAIFLAPSTFRESLCLIDATSHGVCNVWVMKEYGEADSWEKLFIVDKEHHGLTNYPYFKYIRYNGEILFEKIPETPTNERGLVSYDCNNNQVKNIGIPTIGPVFVYTYVDSLVLIKAPNDIKTEEESTEISESI